MKTIETMDESKVGTKLHRFEFAGLGKAPFRAVGSYRSVYQAVPGDPNCPVQPGSSCDYCGNGIALVIQVRDVNGKEFKVGCDCAAKVGDAGLLRYSNSVKAQHERKVRADRKARKTAELAGSAEERCAEILARLDKIGQGEDRWAANVANSMARSLRSGQRKALSDRQLEFVARLEGR